MLDVGSGWAACATRPITRFVTLVEIRASRDPARPRCPAGSIAKALALVASSRHSELRSMTVVDALKRRPALLLAAALLLVGAAFVSRRLSRTPVPMLGEVVQPMVLPVVANVVEGAPSIVLPSNGKHILVLDMFETTCGPCKKSLPDAQHRFDGQTDVHFVAVCLDEERANAEQVASAWGLQKEVAWDAKGEARKQFKVVGIPAMVVIAPNGVVTGNFAYEPSDSEVERALDLARNAI